MATEGSVETAGLRDHLMAVVPVSLDIRKDVLSTRFARRDVIETLKTFLSEQQVSCIYVGKNADAPAGGTAKAEEDDEDEEKEADGSVFVGLEITTRKKPCNAMAFLKRSNFGDLTAEKANVPMGLCLQAISLGYVDMTSPFDLVNTYLQSAIVPLFNTYSTSGGAKGQANQNVQNVVKKIAELSMALMQCQQNMEIPEIFLVTDPFVIQTFNQAREQGSPLPTAESFMHVLGDSSVVNTLHSGVNKWIKEIQRLTKYTTGGSSSIAGSTISEVNFWLNMEKALLSVRTQLQSPEIEFTLSLLRLGKRFLTTVSFEADTGLKSAIDTVANYLLLLRDFPIQELLASTSMEQLQGAVRTIFQHLKKVKTASQYPLARAFQLVEAISRDLKSQILKLLSIQRWMLMEFQEFEESTNGCNELFRCWDDEIRQFKELVRDQVKRRAVSERPPHKIICEHQLLQDRIEDIRSFRRQHKKLKDVIDKILERDNKDLKDAYAVFLTDVDVLDVSSAGNSNWESCKKLYNDKIDRLESQIIAKLRDQLGTARSASDMFLTFQKFNILFFRPRIRGAIQEYQSTLLENIRSVVKKLQEKFKDTYDTSHSARISLAKDIPYVIGSILWAKQIERRLQVCLKRVEDVLGRGWDQHVDGMKIKQSVEAFAKKLNAMQMFEGWMRGLKDGKSFDLTKERLFDIQVQAKNYELVVNTDSYITTLFKEVRNLQALQFRVPYSTKVMADEARLSYPFSASLHEACRIYMQVCMTKLNPTTEMLIAVHHAELQEQIYQGVQLRWASERVEAYARKLCENVYAFQDKVNALNTCIVTMDRLISKLDDIDITATPDKEDSGEQALDTRGKFASIFQQMQNLVDEMNLQNYSNLGQWVKDLSENVEAKLSARLLQLIQEWVTQFLRWPHRGTSLVQEGTVHELRIQQQLLALYPPKEAARQHWIHHFHQTLGIICSLPRLEAARYDAFAQGKKGADENDLKFSTKKPSYAALLNRMPEKTILGAYDAIESILQQTEEYASSWLQYQALWDITADVVFEKLGDNLSAWQQLLQEIKVSRGLMDTSEHEKSFGPIVIDHSKVTTKIMTKYDMWRRDILQEFGDKCFSKLSKLMSNLKDYRNKLEGAGNFEATDPKTVQAVMLVQQIRTKKDELLGEVNQLLDSTKTLTKQKGYSFPEDYPSTEQIQSEWDSLTQIMDRKNILLERELPTLKAGMQAQNTQMSEKIKSVYATWTQEKPIQSDLRPKDAMILVKKFEEKLEKLNAECESIAEASKCIDPTGESSKLPKSLMPLQEEVAGLRTVWGSLSDIDQKMDQLREMPWSAFVPKKVRQVLDDELLGELKGLPDKIAQYEAYTGMVEQVKGLIKMNSLLADLKTDALKERHWADILGLMKFSGDFTSLTLGDMWAADLQKNEAVIREQLTLAQGEMALQEFMKSVKDYWQDLQLELVPFKNKCKLIRGWDDIFSQIDEHLSSLASMKMSPFFKAFEEMATSWDNKLRKAQTVLDLWMDVQRRWVYLEGIFFGSADIQQLLSQEYNRFKIIDAEFVQLCKKATQKLKVLDAVNIENAQKILERLGENLTKVQKALGDYLEKQRSQFARFYFIGDEDLLEIIGNSRDTSVVGHHLGKMFAGLCYLVCKEGTDEIIAMQSREAEEVAFGKPVKISDNPSIHAWLSKVEEAMQNSLSEALEKAWPSLDEALAKNSSEAYTLWVSKYACQTVLIASQINWTMKVEQLLKDGKSCEAVASQCDATLRLLAEKVLEDVDKGLLLKLAQLITEMVHQRDVSRDLTLAKTNSVEDFLWLQLMRLYWNPANAKAKRCEVVMTNAHLYYGFEYLGMAEKLCQTPLTDRCFLTLTQALHMKMGGNPFGPAGTGKTESVKALGAQLGYFVLVFCCDETFDFTSMGRIFVGLCQVGAWGCFDEFNRLEEQMLSACSEQILTIQTGLKQKAKDIQILGKDVRLNPGVGIFITMNPGYAGRSNLPDNLKQLFREMAMITPNKALIAQVILFSKGFTSAERLSGKIVSLFDLCLDQLSQQPHYDFGLRSLKAVLGTAGNLKKENAAEYAGKTAEQVAEAEQTLLIRSVCNTLVPKLVAQDKPLLRSLLIGVFPGCDLIVVEEAALEEEIKVICKRKHYELGEVWLEKVLQLYQIQKITHGVMMVGSVGTGKSAVWRTLFGAMEKIDGIKGEAFVIEPKAITKDELYGRLDNTTMEWTDGVFTATLRKINTLNQQQTKVQKRYWIVFDGDVDPEWAENLNSVLDDNKLLTLPNGERLAIPANVRIMFEVETLKCATLATVSRCGMVWFASDVVTPSMMCLNNLNVLEHGPVLKTEDEIAKEGVDKRAAVRKTVRETVEKFITGSDILYKCLDMGQKFEHIMVYTDIRVLTSMFSLLKKAVNDIAVHNETHDSGMSELEISTFIEKFTVFSICWGFGGAMNLPQRQKFCIQVVEIMSSSSFIPNLPTGLDEETTLLDYEPRLQDGEWHLWSEKVPVLDISPEQAARPDLVIETIDTLRHQLALGAWMWERRPFVLCGPPGSGKSMTLMATLKEFDDIELASLNFSSGTSPELLLQTLNMYCEAVKTQSGIVMRPPQHDKWVVVFCDECNLPEEDNYGTQRVIMFIREIYEQGGFYRPTDKIWVSLERVQFLGACNPPTDAGRWPMSDRFLRHCPILFVDYPGRESLKHIYGTLIKGSLKKAPACKEIAGSIADAMVEFWMASQAKFTVDMEPHYLYSPRELTRWKIAVQEAIAGESGDEMTPTELTRLFIHEGLRIFCDRLVNLDEREWTNEQIDSIAKEYLHADEETIKRPIYFSTWSIEGKGKTAYREVPAESLRAMIVDKIQVFVDEELNVPLVVFDDVLDHVTRIDRVLKQPLGHLLLVGVAGAGKTVLTKFVSYMNDLSIFTIKCGKGYNVLSFEDDLRAVMKRAGCHGEKISFIFDESNALGPAFLERMNALLASGEVPGLFEQDEYTSLIQECKSGMKVQMMDDAEIFAKFTKAVQRNLHIIFTMNPANPDFYNRGASSPALFNRCIIDWFGDWSRAALHQVAYEFTEKLPAPINCFDAERLTEEQKKNEGAQHKIVSEAVVHFHDTIEEANLNLRKMAKKSNFIAPRDFLDFINHFVRLAQAKVVEIKGNKDHISGGLTKLRETEEQVDILRAGLTEKEAELKEKNIQAEKKMQEMIGGQAEAEHKKKETAELSAQLEVKQVEIAKRKAQVESELAEVGPKLDEAKEAVSNISSRDLNELKGMGKNAPAGIQIACRAAVMTMKGITGEYTWEQAGKDMKDVNFIKNIQNFDPLTLKEAARLNVEKIVLSKDWDIQKIMRASKAAGPLGQWCEAQMSYCKILNMMAPLRAEMAAMEAEAAKNTEVINANKIVLGELENRLAQYKADYAVLVATVEKLKNEMESVLSKTSRAEKLMNDLSGEKTRWASSTAGFEKQLDSAVGDTILSGGFLAYIGFFDHFYRGKLLGEWREYLEDEAGLLFTHGLSITDYLVNPADRLRWVTNGLPDDELCIENAVIMNSYQRYPLIIDPSGQAISWVIKEYEKKKLVRTGFLDPKFYKILESALRFGTPVLVQDVEKIDPILNSILNKETHKQGGRVLVTLGDTDIDFSPSFEIFLSCRDATAFFTPDICSRVTFCNFTITSSSLMSQTLNMILKSERPDIDKKRGDMIRMQGEFKVKMREMEDGLLEALAKVEGSILEDDRVVATMEKLKKEGAIITEEFGKIESTMKEVQEVSEEYTKISQGSTRTYFSMEALGDISFLYRYSLDYFFEMFLVSIKDPSVPELGSDYKARLERIVNIFFRNIYSYICTGMLTEDRITLALRLMQIKSDYDGHSMEKVASDMLMKGSLVNVMATHHKSVVEKCATIPYLSVHQVKALQQLMLIPEFHNLPDHMIKKEKEWTAFFSASAGFAPLPSGWDSKLEGKNERSKCLHACLVCKAVAQDFLPGYLVELVGKVMGAKFLDIPPFDLETQMATISKGATPMMMVSDPGFDPSGQITTLAASKKKQVVSMAMGSKEGFATADKMIQVGAKSGQWVVLKNVHLAIEWLKNLEKKLSGIPVGSPDYRLFLCMERNPKLPAALLRQSRCFVFEPPAGVKASLLRSFAGPLSDVTAVEKAPVERCRLHFNLAILHATVLERVRYAPIGWTKRYEFSDADFRCGMTIIDTWIERGCGTESNFPTNVDPKRIPWPALQAIIVQVVYGGRIDNDFDKQLLRTFVDHLFCEACYNKDFKLNKSKEVPLAAPEGRKIKDFASWVENLDWKGSPAWLGLPSNAEKMLRALSGLGTLDKWLKTQSIEDSAYTHEEEKTEQVSHERKASDRKKSLHMSNWLTDMAAKVDMIITTLPPPVSDMSTTRDDDPMWRCFSREIGVGKRLLAQIKKDMAQLKEVCAGNIRITNDLRTLATKINLDQVPDHWRKAYPITTAISTTAWVNDFLKRLKQLGKIAAIKGSFIGIQLWGGGLMFPEAFLTATRQAIAQKNGWSLEELEPIVDVVEKNFDISSKKDSGWLLTDLVLQGAGYDMKNKKLESTDKLQVELPPILFQWVHRDGADAKSRYDPRYMSVPLYLNNQRMNLVTPTFKLDGAGESAVWLQRGAALILWGEG